MRKFYWRIATAILGLVLTATIANVYAQTPSDTTLVIAAPETLNNDPAIVHNASSLRVLLNTYEGLVRFAYGELKTEPALAERWKISQDGRVYTFSLRQGVKFHDGSPLTAADVKYSFDRARAKAAGAAFLTVDVKEVRVIDNQTVEVELTRPMAPYLLMLPRLFIIGQRCVAGREVGGDLGTRYLQENSCGTGPFQVESWERGRQITLKRFEDYWGGWPRNSLVRVVIRVVPEVATARLLLERGDIDIQHSISLDDLPKVANNPNIKIQDNPGIPAVYIHMLMHRGPTKNQLVRMALTYSFPYKAFIGTVMRGTASQLQGALAKDIPCHDSTPPVFQQDLEKAKQLLNQAGYGQGLKLTMTNLSFIEERRQMALLWQSELRKIGVELDYKEVELGTWYAGLRGRETGPSVHILGNFPSYPDPDSYLWRTFHSSQTGEAGFNFSFYENPIFDSLLEQARSTLDQGKRCELYKRAQRMMVNQHIAIWVMQQNSTELHRTRVKNYRPVPAAYQTYYFYPMYKEGR